MTGGGRTLRTLRAAVLLTALGAVWGAGAAEAKPFFLERQYARCSACHYSPSGGGLLTPYGRALTKVEISTFGREGPPGEEGFLYGALDGESPLQLGIELVPEPGRDWPALGDEEDGDEDHGEAASAWPMETAVWAAWRTGRWTLHGGSTRAFGSVEPARVLADPWVSYQATDEVSVRAGRFVPAYGMDFGDHRSLVRAALALRGENPVYQIEGTRSTERSLFQFSAGAGDGGVTGHSGTASHGEPEVAEEWQQVLIAAGRWQFDLAPRMTLVGSALYRGGTEHDPAVAAGGVVFGYSPAPRFVAWASADLRSEGATEGRSLFVTGRLEYELFRGVWLAVAPEWRANSLHEEHELRRMRYSLDFFVRTHWRFDVNYYRDRSASTGRLQQILLAGLHLSL